MDRVRLATTWLGGCSGCHMSFLDLDEWLFDLAAKVDVVFGPVVDAKEYPEKVDVALIEGAVCNEEHLHHVAVIRRHTKIVVAFGDCAVTGNVTSLRNPLGDPDPCLRRAYVETSAVNQTIPSKVVPALTKRVLPVHHVIPVDLFLPGCPPPAPRIRALIEQLLATGDARLAGKDLQFG